MLIVEDGVLKMTDCTTAPKKRKRCEDGDGGRTAKRQKSSESVIDVDGSVCRLLETLVPEEFLVPITEYFAANTGGNERLVERTIKMFGKTHKVPRRECFFGEHGVEYSYSGGKKMRCTGDWGPVGPLRRYVEEATGARFNFCLVNWYADGADRIGWHADDEASIVPCSTIASVSIGATRDFVLRHRMRKLEKRAIALRHGTLFTMEGETQRHYQHCLPARKRVKGWRISLTFRLNTQNE